jgi:hypothetical protein
VLVAAGAAGVLLGLVAVDAALRFVERCLLPCLLVDAARCK